MATAAPVSRRGVLAAYAGIMLATLLAALDQTIVATALPGIVADLRAFEDLSWIVTAYLVASTVTVFGVARTVLGVQVTGEIPWPSRLDRQLIDRLEIRAALLATSVQTAEGVELTDQQRTGDPSRSTFSLGR